MRAFFDNAIAIIGSVLLHALIIYLLLAGFRWETKPPPQLRTTLKASVVSDEAFRLADDEIEQFQAAEPPPPAPDDAEEQRVEQQRERERQAEAERQQRAEAEAQQRAAEEAAQRKAELEAQRQRQLDEQREAQRQADEAAAQAQADAALKAQQEAAEATRQRQQQELEAQLARQQAEAERQREAAEAERKRQAELERQRKEAEAERQRQAELERQRKEAEAERKRLAEEKRQKELEAQMLDAMAAEEARTGAIDAGLQAQYVELIRQAVQRYWIRPAGVPDGIRCEIAVRQLRNGVVASVRVVDCAGGDALIRSIETAVYKASPLPQPPDPSLFEPNLRFPFKTGE